MCARHSTVDSFASRILICALNACGFWCARVDSMSLSVCVRCLRTNALIKIFLTKIYAFPCAIFVPIRLSSHIWNHKFCRRLPRENRQRPKNTHTRTKKLFFQHSSAFAGFSRLEWKQEEAIDRGDAEQQQKQHSALLDERRCQAKCTHKPNGSKTKWDGSDVGTNKHTSCRKCAWKIKCRLMLLSSYRTSNEIPIMFSLVAHSHLLVLSWHKCLPVPVRSHRFIVACTRRARARTSHTAVRFDKLFPSFCFSRVQLMGLMRLMLGLWFFLRLVLFYVFANRSLLVTMPLLRGNVV